MNAFLAALWKSEPLMKLRRLKQRLLPRPEHIGIGADHPLRFTQKTRGLIHIGAHDGEEAWIYNALKVPRVIWVEGNPDLMERLRANISAFRGQTAVQGLLTERTGEIVCFHVTNNDGASSSILPLGRCHEMYPEVAVTQKKTLRSDTLARILSAHDPFAAIDSMVIDVQGAELAVLRGAGDRLKQFRWIFAECADFELYKGGCTIQTLSEFLDAWGFVETKRFIAKTKPEIGTTCDILFERKAAPRS